MLLKKKDMKKTKKVDLNDNQGDSLDNANKWCSKEAIMFYITRLINRLYIYIMLNLNFNFVFFHLLI